MTVKGSGGLALKSSGILQLITDTIVLMDLSRIRKIINDINAGLTLKSVLLYVCIGLIIGTLSKASDSYYLLSQLTGEISIWIIIGMLIAYFSRRPIEASVKTFVFFIFNLAGYYAYTQFILGFSNINYAISWLVVTLLGAVAACVLWLTRRQDYVGSLVASIPIGLLFAINYPVFYTYKINSIICLLLSLGLIFVLRKTFRQKLITLLLSTLVAIVIVASNLLAYIPY